ncbi:MAG: NAD-glutamate dehydrogenase domain-containing protein, partial [Candidatus Binataceae bacterium]
MARAGALSEIIERNFTDDEAARAKRFAERLFAREPHDRLDHSLPDHYLAALKSAYGFFLQRAEPIAVSVTPATDSGGVLIVETAMLDRSFIVDSLLAYFHQLGAPVLAMLHPVYRLTRDAGGTIASFEQASAAEWAESLTYTELELAATPADAERIAREVRAVLVEVEQATGDFDPMVARALQICEETAANRELVDVRDFLRWLVQGGFVFLGYRHYDLSGDGHAAKFSVEAGSELGIMRDHDESRFRSAGSLDDIAPARRKLFFDGPPLVIGKALAESLVHRRAPMDSVTIRRTNAAGRATGFDHFVGLFTSKAYAEEAQHIPTLRAKLQAVLKAEGAIAGSHDYKELVSAFNSFPKDELFRAPVSELCAQLRVILDLKNEATVRLCVLSDAYRGNVIAMVVMPREAYSAKVRQNIQDALAAGLRGTLIYCFLAMGEGYLARLHFSFAAEPPKAQKIKALETEVARLAHRWQERLAERLVEKWGAARGRALGMRWAGAFTDEYRAAVPARRAIADIEKVEELLKAGATFHVELGPRASAGEDADELRMLGVGEPPMLSELMPMLQNFGIKVLAEEVHLLKPQDDGRIVNAYVQAFAVEGPGRQPLRKSPGADTIADAIDAVRADLSEDDPLNALVVSAGLKWREAALLRTYLEAAFQMRLAPARPALRRVLLNNPALARAMFELFAARLDPDRNDPAKIADLRAAYLAQLGSIENIADDRAARMLLMMLEATVRTNFFCPAPDLDPYLALKFESGKIAGLPDTAPLYEIHVNSARMAGCHLRAGK